MRGAHRVGRGAEQSRGRRTQLASGASRLAAGAQQLKGYPGSNPSGHACGRRSSGPECPG
ncbi:hypothetical protein [Sinomonas terricola]|uniref:hypothetical protein n=1 Tax=Sinomonas terricola TaxID=3110330 RepID=UPI003D1747A0